MTTNQVVLPELPINTCLVELGQALKAGHVTLTASTGSGKTTIVPLSLLDQPWLAGKKIIMLEPRRPAARMAAHRMAQLLGEKTGQTVGYQVRFERQISVDTRIEVLTEGLLLKRLQSDPELSDVGLIIFDEFHERSLVADVSLALCIDVCQGLRDDLRLLIMSATLDSDRLGQLLKAKNISAKGRLFPVTMHYAEQDFPLDDVVEACLPLIDKALGLVKADVLVFLPGRKEIGRLQTLAEQKWPDDCEVFTLYGDLSTEKQDQILNPSNRKRRRLILATDIAETSLTIEGIEAVVDGGRVRKPVFQPNNGLTRLQMQWVSKASASQRTGRAGRLGPGHCFRAWTKSFEQRLEDFITPEIFQADLAATVLEVAAWGINQADQLQWFDFPPHAHWQQAVGLLYRLGALDIHGYITAQGREMSVIPVHPRLAHMLLQATAEEDKVTVADIAALLTDRDPLIRNPGGIAPVDITLRLSMLNRWRQCWRDQRQSVQGADIKTLKQLERLSTQFLKLLPHKKRPAEKKALEERGREGKAVGEKAREQKQQAKGLSAGAYLAMAYPDRIAKRRSNGGGYLMANGRGVTLPQDDPLIATEYLVIANLDAGKRDGRAWLAAAIDFSEIENLFAGQIQHQRLTVWDDNHQKVIARQQSRLDKLTLTETQVPIQKDERVIDILVEQVKKQGLALFGDSDKLESLRARIQILHQLKTFGDWPDMSEPGLLANLDAWLVPWMDNISSLKQLKQIDLVSALQSWLGWDKQKQLDKLMPELYQTPAGTNRKIQYNLNEQPTLSVPLQEMLGVSETPTIAGGQLPLVIHLLSPAGRPLQVTKDLATFWQGAYQEVKKEMRGRYPKHYWPDDPASAAATRFTKKHLKKQD